MHRKLNRRHFLRGVLGVGVGLPLLEVMGGADQSDGDAPTRIAYVYVPNGMRMNLFSPAESGENFQLPPTLLPLEKHRRRITVLSGLSNLPAKQRVESIDNHGRASGLFLTNLPLDEELRNGQSVDQLAATHLGRRTRFPSMHISCATAPLSGQTQELFWRTLSWSQDGVPIPSESDPRIIFDRLFCRRAAASAAFWSKRREDGKSLLDFVLDDARQLSKQVSKQDRAKMDEYLSSVRSVERRIAQAEAIPIRQTDDQRPTGIPDDLISYFQLMIDLTILAFQVDATRIVTLMLGHEAGKNCYRMLGIDEPHHKLSHHQGEQTALEKIAKIDLFHVRQFARMLEKMQRVKERGVSLLDQSIVLFGSGLSDGNKHSFENLPLVLAGRGGGSLRQGRHLKLPKDTPLANLHITLLQAAGVDISEFGDSTGTIRNLLA